MVWELKMTDESPGDAQHTVCRETDVNKFASGSHYLWECSSKEGVWSEGPHEDSFGTFRKSFRMTPLTGRPVRLRHPEWLRRTPSFCEARNNSTHSQDSLRSHTFITWQMFILGINSEIGGNSRTAVMSFIQPGMCAHGHTRKQSTQPAFFSSLCQKT